MRRAGDAANQGALVAIRPASALASASFNCAWRDIEIAPPRALPALGDLGLEVVDEIVRPRVLFRDLLKARAHDLACNAVASRAGVRLRTREAGRRAARGE